MRPDHGGRIELKLLADAAESARYALTIATPDSVLESEVTIDGASGALELGDWSGGTPPEWLGALSRALLRSVWRTRSSDGVWPRRLTRWRPAPKP